MTVRISAVALLAVCLAACAPKGPVPAQCSADSDCFAGGACNAGGTCVTGAAIDKDKSTVEISQPQAVADGQDEVSITVTLRDAQGNALSSRGVQLSVDGTANTLTQPSLATNSIGQVVGKLTSTKAETKTIHALAGIVVGQATTKGVQLTKTASVKFNADAAHIACAPGVTGATCTSVGTPAQASALTITAADGTSAPNVPVDTATGVKIHLVLKDANGNPVPGATVNFNVVGASLVLTPPSGTGTTGSDGSFTATVSSTLAQNAVVIFDAGGLHVVKTVTFHPGPVSPPHSALTTKVGGVECGVTAPCSIAADGGSGPIAIEILAKDQFDNLVQDAAVWFSSDVASTGNTVGSDTAEADYCTAKGVTCDALQAAPLLTQADGRVTANFTSPHAGNKTITAHLGSAAVDLNFIVVAGAPDGLMSQFVILGHPDGSPVIANAQLAPGDDSYLVGVYVADKFDNPIEGVTITFDVVSCVGGPPCTPGAAVPGDVQTPIQDPDTGKTDVEGTYSILLSGTAAGTRYVSASGAPLDTAHSTGTLDFSPGNPTLSQSSLTLKVGANPPCATCSISSDPNHPIHIAVVLRDANGNAAPNQDLTLDAKIGSASGASCTACTFTLPTYDAGTATYAADFASSQAQNLMVTADVTLASGTVHLEQALAITPGGINPGNSSVAVDAANTSAPLTANGVATARGIITLKDTQGNPVPGVTPSIFVSPATGVTTGAIAPTGANGQTNFSFTSSKAEQKTVSVSFAGPPGPLAAFTTLGQTVQYTFVPGAPAVPGAAPSTFSAAPATIVAAGNGSILTLVVKDPTGNPVPNFAITFTDTPANGSFSGLTPANGQTDANGVLTVVYKSTVATSETITAKSGLTTFLSTNVTVQVGAASTANSTMTPPSQSVVADGSTTGTLTVTERDPSNNLINDCVAVTSSGTATISAAAGGVSGVTSFTVKATAAGTQTFTAFDKGAFPGCAGTPTPFAQATVTFNADAAHPSAGNSGIGVSPSSIPADFATVATVSVTVKDGNGTGNPIPGAAVTFASSDGNDAFSCSGTASCITNASGVASSQVRGKVTGVHTITATVPGSPGFPKSIPVTVTPGAPSKLAFLNAPSDVNAGTPMAQLKVAVEDQFGNQVPTAASLVTLALQTASGTAGSLANNTVNTVGGVAVYNALVPTGTGGGLCDGTHYPCRTLVASASGLANSAPSALFHVIPPNSSTGAEGDLNVASGNLVIPAGLHNYGTITIAAGAHVFGDGNGVLDLRATGDVIINGTLDVSGGSGGNVGNQVNGGGSGGSAGSGQHGADGPYDAYGSGGRCINGSFGAVACSASIAVMGNGNTGGGGWGGQGGGQMGGGGMGGASNSYDYNAGGGGGGGGAGGGAGGFAGADGCIAAGAAGGGSYGGGATGCGATGQGGGQACPGAYAGGNGAVGASGCTPIAGSGGGGSIGCDAAADLAMSSTFRPGSGGGGGGNGGDANGEARSGGGGGGGGGGGALRITSPTRIVVGTSGAILARGGAGGFGGYSADDCVDDSGGGGGGGSGGALWLQAPNITVPASGVLSAAGGGGGNAGATSSAGPGGTGGLGRIRLSFDPAQSSLNGANVVPPLPAGANAAAKTFVVTYPQ